MKNMDNKGKYPPWTSPVEKAIDANNHVLVTYPDNADTIVNIASAMIEMGKYDEAIVECNRALEIDPDHYLAPVFLQQAKEKIKYERPALK